MRTEALNGLKKGDRVQHIKSTGKSNQYKHLNNGIADDVSLSGKQVYVRWYDEHGKSFHWAKYNCETLEKIGGDSE